MYQVTQPVYVEDLINDPSFNINDWHGYVYMTTNLELNKKYIGKKIFKNTTNKKLGKKETAALPTKRGRTPSKKKVIVESNWKEYFGSTDEIKEWVKNTPKDKLLRTVIRLCKDKKSLTYYEVKYQFIYNVLENDDYVNSNILGRFFSKDLE